MRWDIKSHILPLDLQQENDLILQTRNASKMKLQNYFNGLKEEERIRLKRKGTPSEHKKKKKKKKKDANVSLVDHILIDVDGSDSLGTASHLTGTTSNDLEASLDTSNAKSSKSIDAATSKKLVKEKIAKQIKEDAARNNEKSLEERLAEKEQDRLRKEEEKVRKEQERMEEKARKEQERDERREQDRLRKEELKVKKEGKKKVKSATSTPKKVDQPIKGQNKLSKFFQIVEKKAKVSSL
jgi:hypothetical protein